MSDKETNDRPGRIMMRQIVSTEYVIRIAREITEPDDFYEELQVLASATENDVVKIQGITIGGSVDTAHLLCRAIRECQALTIGQIGSTCASAGTSIMLACDEWEVDEMSSFMCHTGSYGNYGKAGEVKASTEHNTKMIDRWVHLSYDGFLSQDEIERLIDGKDYYFEGEELMERLAVYAQHRDDKQQEAIEEIKAQIDKLKEEE